MEYRSRQAFSAARLCRESGLKGVHQKASGGRIIATAPAGSGNAARPVPGRTRDTDHRQRCSRAAPPALAPKKEELRDIIIHSGSTGQTFCPAGCQRVISRQSFPHSSHSTGASGTPVTAHASGNFRPRRILFCIIHRASPHRLPIAGGSS